MIYLDYQATTPLAPEALDAMLPWLKGHFANPHSAHRPGREAAAAVEVARDQVQSALGLDGQLVFTSGATEALNIAIQGVVRLDSRRRKLVTLVTEHAAVRGTMLALGEQGYEAVLLPVRTDGIVDLAAAAQAIDDDTALVAAMLVNNEIGVIQPVEALCALTHEAGALLLCDAVQGFGRVLLPTQADMIAVSAHKVHGPKGIGALWLREGLKLPPLIHGGGQGGGPRSGTLSPALCVGFGVAALLLSALGQADRAHVQALWDLARDVFADWTLNGSAEQRYRGNMNLRRDGLDAARLMSDCRDIAFSLGSACASRSGRPSHVWQAIGLTNKEAQSSIRLGFGRYTQSEDVALAAQSLNRAAMTQAVMQEN